MNNYDVEVGKMVYGSYNIDAESKEEALLIAKKYFMEEIIGIEFDEETKFDYEEVE